jgi:hypothetical protein
MQYSLLVHKDPAGLGPGVDCVRVNQLVFLSNSLGRDTHILAAVEREVFWKSSLKHIIHKH